MRISSALRLVVVTVAVLGVAGAAVAQEIETTPNKPYTAAPSSNIPIVTIADLINTAPFVCGGGLGPYTTAYRGIDDPDEYEFFRGFCAPGDTVDIEVYRTTSEMDPAMHACEGDWTGTDTAPWFDESCPVGATFLGYADDDIGPYCAGGSFSDPQLSFTCPATGVFTLAVYDYIGDGPTPTFEVHASGLAPAAPSVPTAGLLVLAALVLASGVFVLARRRFTAV